MITTPSSKEKTEVSYKNDEINFYLLFDFINRNKKKISIVSFIFFVLACLYSLSLKRIWSGEFQIVLNSQTLGVSSVINPTLENFLTRGQNNQLKTQVGILKSPSILIPIYEFVIESKNLELEKNKLRFDKWEKNLQISLERNTSILDITYEDTDKELILPVLDKISLAYQDYSQKSIKRSQELTKKFLNEQISIFKKKSSQSLREAQEFALDQDLIFFDRDNSSSINIPLQKNKLARDPFTNKGNQDELLRSNTGIIRARINAANNIRRIDEQIKKINELGDDVEKVQYIGSTIPRLVQEGLPSLLADLQQELAQRKTIYTEDDRSIVEIIKRRKILINLIKTRAIGYLKAQRLDAEAIMNASMRPKGVLLKYKELVRNASRDESTLINLEGQLRLIELEEAKLADPWELITNPTLAAKPVGPSRSKIGIIGLLFGFLSCSGYIFYKEKKSNKVFNIDSIIRFLPTNLIGSISLNNLELSDEKFAYFVDYVNNGNWDKLSLIAIGELDRNIIKSISESLVKNNIKKKNEINLVFSPQELKNSLNSDLKIVCLSLGKLTISQLKEYEKYINLFSLSLDGILLIKDEA